MPPTTPPASNPVSAALASLTVRDEPARSGYSREKFPHWIDADGDGCKTRCEVLGQEERTDLPGLPKGWYSYYDGATTADASSFDVDHLVPLAEAWDSGAAQWDQARRQSFANDLDEPLSLIAVSATSNRQKSDQDPAEWRPARTDTWCVYATSWVTVKARWQLSVDPAEHTALTEMLATCP